MQGVGMTACWFHGSRAIPDDLELLLDVRCCLEALEQAVKECRRWLYLIKMSVPWTPVSANQWRLQSQDVAGVRVDRSSDLLPDPSAHRGDYMRMLGVAMASRYARPCGKRANSPPIILPCSRQVNAERVGMEALFETYDFVISPAGATGCD
jgi:hypothetical protein